MKSILDFQKAKQEKRKLSMVTCYDAWSAKLLAKTNVDCLLVGDSLAMILHGHPTTLNATVDMMELHTEAVSRGSSGLFIVADLPFLSFRKGVSFALDAAGRLLQAGAHAVKLEGVRGHEDVVKALVETGIPVMGHLGLTPQSVHQLGGYKVQGVEELAKKLILEDALTLEKLGCFSIVLECVPQTLATQITKKLAIPTIGIGAGVGTDGQVLVLHDLLGFQVEFKPKFVRRFSEGAPFLSHAVNAFHQAVVNETFPTSEESYG